MSTHAKLSPSGAYRWLNCPASVQLCEALKVKSEPNEYSAQGTLAHTLGEKVLQGEDFGDWLNTSHTVDGFNFTITSDMIIPVDEYVCYVKKTKKQLDAEMQLEVFCDLKSLGVDGLDGGTADCLLISKNKRTLEIIDYKHGVNFVDPINNTQLMQYALGALIKLGVDDFDEGWTVALTIVQPRAYSESGSVRTWITYSDELFDWRDTVLIPGAKKTQEKDPTFSPGESVCKYCPAAGNCPALMKKTEMSVVNDFSDLVSVDKLTVEQKIKVLDNQKLIGQFISAVAAQVESDLKNGSKDYVGKYKLVEQKKNRTFTDDVKDKDFSDLLEYLPSHKVFEPKLLSISAVTKNLVGVYGKDEADEILKKVTYTPKGDAVLAPASDKRKEFVPVDDFESLKGGGKKKK